MKRILTIVAAITMLVSCGSMSEENIRPSALNIETSCGEIGDYVVTLYRDGDNAGWNTNPTDYIIEQKEVTKTDMLNIAMAPGGGFAISIKAL